MSRRRREAATAFHEAGHAVTAWKLGFKVHRITIRPDGDYAGAIEHESPLKGVRLDLDDSDRTRMRTEKAIMICLAGPIAQRRFSAASWRHYHGAHDRELAVDLALHLNGSSELATAYLKWLDLRTESLIEANWPFVESLAVALIQGRTLDAEQALAAIRKPIQDRSRRAAIKLSDNTASSSVETVEV